MQRENLYNNVPPSLWRDSFPKRQRFPALCQSNHCAANSPGAAEPGIVSPFSKILPKPAIERGESQLITRGQITVWQPARIEPLRVREPPPRASAEHIPFPSNRHRMFMRVDRQQKPLRALRSVSIEDDSKCRSMVGKRKIKISLRRPRPQPKHPPLLRSPKPDPRGE